MLGVGLGLTDAHTRQMEAETAVTTADKYKARTRNGNQTLDTPWAKDNRRPLSVHGKSDGRGNMLLEVQGKGAIRVSLKDVAGIVARSGLVPQGQARTVFLVPSRVANHADDFVDELRNQLGRDITVVASTGRNRITGPRLTVEGGKLKTVGPPVAPPPAPPTQPGPSHSGQKYKLKDVTYFFSHNKRHHETGIAFPMSRGDYPSMTNFPSFIDEDDFEHYESFRGEERTSGYTVMAMPKYGRRANWEGEVVYVDCHASPHSFGIKLKNGRTASVNGTEMAHLVWQSGVLHRSRSGMRSTIYFLSCSAARKDKPGYAIHDFMKAVWSWGYQGNAYGAEQTLWVQYPHSVFDLSFSKTPIGVSHRGIMREFRANRTSGGSAGPSAPPAAPAPQPPAPGAGPSAVPPGVTVVQVSPNASTTSLPGTAQPTYQYVTPGTSSGGYTTYTVTPGQPWTGPTYTTYQPTSYTTYYVPGGHTPAPQFTYVPYTGGFGPPGTRALTRDDGDHMLEAFRRWGTDPLPTVPEERIEELTE